MSGLSVEELGGHRAVEVLSSLCQRMRVADPLRHGWEAADLQWWWRRKCSTDEQGRLLVRSDAGDVVGAVVLTDFGRYCQLDVLSVPGLLPGALQFLWTLAAQRAACWEGTELEVLVDLHDEGFTDPIAAEGFTSAEDSYVDAWLDVADRLTTPRLAPGFELRTQAAQPTSPHHFVQRNGTEVASRLAQCSLYDAALDLYVVGPAGLTCAYGLFWADPITGVGLVEPMRTEEPHEHQGIASHVLGSGLDLLAERGCTRLKVSSAGPLYEKAGFRVGAGSARTLQRAG